MPRLLALLAVGAACAASLDLENEQRHDVFDDALDDAAALLAPDHAAAKDSTARAEAALARDDPYLAVEPTREVERLEPEVFDDELGPLLIYGGRAAVAWSPRRHPLPSLAAAAGREQ